MKIFYQILIAIFLIFSFIITKDDLSVLYDRGISFVEKEISLLKNDSSVGSSSEVPVSKDGLEKITELPKLKVQEGISKITDDVFSQNSNYSVKGVIEETNKFRSQNKLEPLKENPKLDFSARVKLDDMFKNQYFEHVSPSGTKVSDLGDMALYDYITIGENLALGNFKNDSGIVLAWMESPGHRANILSKIFTEIGVAVGEGTFNGKKVLIAVQHFGLPKDTCPVVDEVLADLIAIKEKQAGEMEKDLSVRRDHIDSGAIYDGKTTKEQIDEYNVLVPIYNNLILDLKHDINSYNEQVKSFNACAEKYIDITTTSTQE